MKSKEKQQRVAIMVNEPARRQIKSVSAQLGLTLVDFMEKLSTVSLEEFKKLLDLKK